MSDKKQQKEAKPLLGEDEFDFLAADLVGDAGNTSEKDAVDYERRLAEVFANALMSKKEYDPATIHAGITKLFAKMEKGALPQANLYSTDQVKMLRERFTIARLTEDYDNLKAGTAKPKVHLFTFLAALRDAMKVHAKSQNAKLQIGFVMEEVSRLFKPGTIATFDGMWESMTPIFAGFVRSLMTATHAATGAGSEMKLKFSTKAEGMVTAAQQAMKDKVRELWDLAVAGRKS